MILKHLVKHLPFRPIPYLLLFSSEALMEKPYADIDYNSFPVADLFADLHWIQLPASRWEPIRQKMRQEAERKRLAELPKEHKVTLVPADPTYSPSETELWPLVNRAVHQTLAGHPGILEQVGAAIDRLVEEHRGWRNPFPSPFADPKPAHPQPTEPGGK